MSVLPLSGIRVLDLTRVLAGPYCTMVLADLGADVVKIERPGVGDDSRLYGPFLPSGQSAYFASVNRGKKSVVLDLKDAGDRDILLRLVDRADVLVENFRPGTMEAAGLGVDVLRARNPRLVSVSATGFGQTGPDAAEAAYDVIVQARSGLMGLTGHAGGEPVRVGASISDIITGLYGAIAVMAALQSRGRTGRGSAVDLAMLDCSVSVLENAFARYAVSGVMPGPIGTRHPSIAPFQAFRAADESLVIAAGNDKLWAALCGVLGAPELVADPLLATNRGRAAHLGHLEQRVNERLAARPAGEWLVLLRAAGVPSAAIQSVAEVLDDPQLAAREMWHTLVDDDGFELVTASTPFMFDGVKPELAASWPALGEHTDEVVRRWLHDSVLSELRPSQLAEAGLEEAP
jgi:CoA:oxalate CoA-transferase